MRPSVAGALAMNIHGKNNPTQGTFGEHVVEIEGFLGSGEPFRMVPGDGAFEDMVSSAGLLGVITAATLRLKRVPSGLLEVQPRFCARFDDHFRAFEAHDDWEYRVSWVDIFSGGSGLFHAARPTVGPEDMLWPERQDLPARILGVVPKSHVWRVLRALNSRPTMRWLNRAKSWSAGLAGERPTTQPIVAFQFLLDYVPGWELAYPHGFIQYQSFVPAECAREVFGQQIEMQRRAGLEAHLGVLKRHRADRFLFSHGVDGYSLALDFRVDPADWSRLRGLCWAMNDLVLAAGGKFYFAKDSTLRPSDAEGFLDLARFRARKAEWDPAGALTSALAERLRLSG
jgi:decaprenylphospho-beta-D-ribofuranose 2-oxidase